MNMDVINNFKNKMYLFMYKTYFVLILLFIYF